MPKSYIALSVKQFIIVRARGCCEYCKCPADFSAELFSIEHILPLSRLGVSTIENLAYACSGCNIFKSNRTAFLDTISQKLHPLFNPRTMVWDDHFLWDETFTVMIGKTAIGRVTISALQLNRRQVKNLRRALMAIDEHPPK